MSRSLLSLILLAALTFFLGLGRPAITDSDEAFYAEASREMVESGDWLSPRFNYENRWQKPVLYYWLTAATYGVAGQSEWSARFWAAMSGLGLVLLTFAAARFLTQRDPVSRNGSAPFLDAAWLSGAIVATCFGYFAMARAALPDLPLAFLITLGIWTALRQRWLLAGMAAGLGFLMKGPVALVVPALVLIPIWWRERRTTHLRIVDIVRAAVVFAAIGLPWYAAMTQEHGTAYLQSFFLADNFERFATDRFNDPRPFWFYVPIVIGGFLPWAGFLLVVPWRAARDLWRRSRQLTDVEWRLLIWALLPLLFFTLSVGKQPRYILPILPPLAILLGRALADRIRDAATSPAASRDLAIGTWLTVGVYSVLALLLLQARPLFIGAWPPLTSAALGAMLASAVALTTILVQRRWALLPLIMPATAVVFLLSIQFGALYGIRPEPVEQMAALVQQHRTTGEAVGEYRTFVRNMVFYTRFKQAELFDEPFAVEFLKSQNRVLLVVAERDLARLESLSGVRTTTLGGVDYLDTAGIRIGTLLNPAPNTIQRVLLVTNQPATPELSIQ